MSSGGHEASTRKLCFTLAMKFEDSQELAELETHGIKVLSEAPNLTPA